VDVLAGRLFHRGRRRCDRIHLRHPGQQTSSQTRAGEVASFRAVAKRVQLSHVLSCGGSLCRAAEVRASTGGADLARVGAAAPHTCGRLAEVAVGRRGARAAARAAAGACSSIEADWSEPSCMERPVVWGTRPQLAMVLD